MSAAGRAGEAKALPVLEVAGRLGLAAGLRQEGREHVGACPICGDGGKRAPNRFALNPDLNVWICRQCDQGGDTLDLVQFVQACDFKAALGFLLGGDAAGDPAERRRREQEAAAREKARRQVAERKRAEAIAQARDIWNSALPGAGTLAEVYLAGRGLHLDPWPFTLRFLPAHRYISAKVDHRGPCMVAAVQDRAGRVAAVHQTYLTPEGRKAEILDRDGAPMPAKLVRGSKKGGAIRFGKLAADRPLVMGEGIETTLSAGVLNLVPGAVLWAGVDLGNMAGRQLRVPGQRYSGRPDPADDAAAFVPPARPSRLVYLQDGDSDPKSTAAKLQSGLRRARAHYPGLPLAILPAPEGQDFNDLLQKQKTEFGND
ncbi:MULTISPECIES: hypothetical protein [unclassified Sulfitobacter]|uniref:DUF7146 domain-containing protein n=1 Tax=unclassified Sulfitobacter TaxID=196795 RepID=UPI0023E2C6E9|nr:MULTISPECIES: hypothetical protein [unclassified Sulfitobacter]MDF3383346.1 hypothetical protein [Sulfitobacter sp. Ks11]MDF3386765.1 hypothetical protein [Sulfitobacter sp. M85]MDF3390184.1 hypothetical protein [Sulfitobacter sp. Ks16]MDF3400821.1 hypothetical protein [Sulfitobacter sp. KE39]MDF3404242.1 hypothetical protein [Sulfitobacter sp. Ks35]